MSITEYLVASKFAVFLEFGILPGSLILAAIFGALALNEALNQNRMKVKLPLVVMFCVFFAIGFRLTEPYKQIRRCLSGNPSACISQPKVP